MRVIRIIYVQSGDIDAARREAAELLRLRPAFSVSAWAKTQMYAYQKDAKKDINALLQAGLPQ